MAKRSGPIAEQRRAWLYLRLSVDKEGGDPQSIAAQRSALRAYAAKHGLEVVDEFVDAGISGTTDRRPAFRDLVRRVKDDDRPDVVLLYCFSRMARNMRLFFNTIGEIEDQGIEVVSITEDFGAGRGRRIGRAVSALVAEMQADDSSILTRKSRRENARQGHWNGGPLPFGYKSVIARQDGDKARMKLAIVPDEVATVRRMFDWALAGRGNRWIGRTLNEEGVRLRGAKFSNGNVAGILTREHYAGQYRDLIADDDGQRPSLEDAIIVSCPAVVERYKFDQISSPSRRP